MAGKNIRFEKHTKRCVTLHFLVNIFDSAVRKSKFEGNDEEKKIQSMYYKYVYRKMITTFLGFSWWLELSNKTN